MDATADISSWSSLFVKNTFIGFQWFIIGRKIATLFVLNTCTVSIIVFTYFLHWLGIAHTSIRFFLSINKSLLLFTNMLSSYHRI